MESDYNFKVEWNPHQISFEDASKTLHAHSSIQIFILYD